MEKAGVITKTRQRLWISKRKRRTLWSSRMGINGTRSRKTMAMKEPKVDQNDQCERLDWRAKARCDGVGSDQIQGRCIFFK